ncbi:DUF2946 domain-containing protein [Paraburkholderia oxyphila]|uniref:DUF2946 domain-containing protein n=1 Tax=Paraburkholderia oxyphila TaxID=614212 RepID=UPI00047F2194|nr:DUF2946 domain-containing protein [Paraburkholderia oxyphila]
MQQAAKSYRRLTWIVVLAIMFGACAPILSRILESRQLPQPWEVCGAGAHQTESGLSAAPATEDGRTLKKLDPCAFCALLQHAPALPVKVPPWQALSFWFGRMRRTTEVCRGQKRFRRRAHRSRAPPSQAPLRA